MNSAPLHNPGVWFPPPLLFVFGMVCGWLLHRVWPLPLSWSGRTLFLSLGWLAVLGGLCLLFWAVFTFRLARTGIYPNQRASEIVERGPYRFSRNPMYTAMTAMTAGVGLLVNTLWILLLIPVVLALVYRLVIRREEAYLSSAFGERYAEYCRRVRRWP